MWHPSSSKTLPWTIRIFRLAWWDVIVSRLLKIVEADMFKNSCSFCSGSSVMQCSFIFTKKICFCQYQHAMAVCKTFCSMSIPLQNNMHVSCDFIYTTCLYFMLSLCASSLALKVCQQRLTEMSLERWQILQQKLLIHNLFKDFPVIPPNVWNPRKGLSTCQWYSMMPLPKLPGIWGPFFRRGFCSFTAKVAGQGSIGGIRRGNRAGSLQWREMCQRHSADIPPTSLLRWRNKGESFFAAWLLDSATHVATSCSKRNTPMDHPHLPWHYTAVILALKLQNVVIQGVDRSEMIHAKKGKSFCPSAIHILRKNIKQSSGQFQCGSRDHWIQKHENSSLIVYEIV